MKKSKDIKALLFDMGGVIIDLNFQGCKDKFKRDLGYEKIDQLLDPCHQKGIIKMLEAGEISADDFRNRVLADCRPGCRPEQVDECMYTILHCITPEKAALMKELSEQYDLYLLSNNNEICWKRGEYLFEEAGIPVDTLFKDVFISYRMKVLKPEPKIFQMSQERMGVAMENIMFIDDSESNAMAATRLGMCGVYYPLSSDFRSTIEAAL